jgi:hypothetical protein
MELVPSTSAPPRQNIPLFVRLGDVPVGRTKNLSITGIFLETHLRPDVGSQHDLWLAWGESTFSCKVRVVRHADDGIGIVFEEPDVFFAQAVEEILSDSDVPPPPLQSA